MSILGFVKFFFKVGKNPQIYCIWLGKYNVFVEELYLLIVQFNYKGATWTQYTNRPYNEGKCVCVCLLFQNKRLEGEVEKNEQQIEKFKSNMKKIETENKVLHF